MTDIRFVSVVVPTFERPEFLDECLERIAAQRGQVPFEVIVVDDGSDDEETAAVVARYETRISDLKYVYQANGGAGAARNAGARRAMGDLLLFVDDDILIEPDHIERHVANHCLFENCAVNAYWEFSPKAMAALLATPFGRFRQAVESWYWQTDRVFAPFAEGRERAASVVSWNLSMRPGLYWAVGGFDESIGHAGLEDQEFSIRALEAGLVPIVDPAIRLLQNEAFATLDAFCARRQRGAYDTVCAAKVRPEIFGNRPMIVQNLPPRLSDPPHVLFRKVGKGLAATRTGEQTLRLTIRILERLSPNGKLLRHAYWSLSGIYILRGVREGIASVGRDPG